MHLTLQCGLAHFTASTGPCSVALQLSRVRLAGDAKIMQQMAEKLGAVCNHSAAASQPPLVPCNDRQDANAAAPAVQIAADTAVQAAAEPGAWAWSPPALPPQQPPDVQEAMAAPHSGDNLPTPAHGHQVRVHAETLKQMGISQVLLLRPESVQLLMLSDGHRC